MISSVNSATPVFSMPDKPFMNAASSSFFGTLFQENTSQFATLETAQKIAGVLGGKVVDMSGGWTGGSQTTQYGIQLTDNGPILNAGLIAQRCMSCGTEAGLSAALQEAKSVSGQSISYSEAMSDVLLGEQNYMASSGQTSSTKQTAAAAPATPLNNVATPPKTTPAPLFSGYGTPAATESVLTSSALTAAASAAATSDAATAAAATLPDRGTVIPAKSESSKLVSSARDFEALMIGQMLKSVREASNGGWLGSESESSTGSAVEMAETQVAQSLAAAGGLGLGNMVLKSLERRAEVITPSFDLPRS